MKLLKCFIVLFVASTLFGCAPIEGLFYHVKEGDIAGVQPYIEKGEIEKVDREGMTPLMYAAYYGQAKMAEYLCEKGADVNKQDDIGYTALMYAAYYNYPRVVEVLLNHGASTEIVNKEDKKAIDYARKFNHDEVIELLESSEST